MPNQALAATIGLFGKLPAHGDFVRRGLAPALAAALDDWLQAELGRFADPAAVIRDLTPARLATTALEPGKLAVGAIVASWDRVGRVFPLVALRVTEHASGALPEVMSEAWDDWGGRAEAMLTAARNAGWTADAAAAALEASARATMAALVPPPPFAVPDSPEPETLAWRPVLLPGPRDVWRTPGLPSGAAFARLLGHRQPA